MEKHWVALASMGGTMVVSMFYAGMRLGALEQKVDQLATTVQTIAPPTVKVGDITIPLSKDIDGPLLTASVPPKAR